MLQEACDFYGKALRLLAYRYFWQFCQFDYLVMGEDCGSLPYLFQYSLQAARHV